MFQTVVISENKMRRYLFMPLICSWAISQSIASGMDDAKTPTAQVPAKRAQTPLLVTPVVAPASNPAGAPATKPDVQPVAAASAKTASSKASPVTPGTGQTGGGQAGAGQASPAQQASAQAPASAATVRSHDSQVAMDTLQAINPSGWNPGPTKIFMPGIEPVSNSITRSQLQTPPSPEEDAVQKAVSAAPQFLPFEQLTTEVDGQRVSILKEFRCYSVYTKNFKRGQRVITARVYEFSNPESAYGAYSMLRQGASTVVRRGDASSEDDQGISFWQGRTFVSIYGTSIDDDESKEVVRGMADKFSHVLQEHAALPQILDQIPRLNIVKGSEHIVMGTLSARKFSPAPFLNYLDFSHAVAAATADYQIPPDRLKLLYVDFQYPGYAAAAYRSYAQNFEGRSVPIEEPLIGETCMYKSGGTFILCQQVGERLAIISGAKKKQSAATLARFLH
jgi:hypothetical protein